MAEKLEENIEEACGRCRQKKADHILVNFAGGTIVGPIVLICPTGVYLPAAETPSAGAVR